MVLPIAAAIVAMLAAALKLRAGVTLMTSYRVDEYLATPRARRLYWTVMLSPLAVGASIVALACCTGFWWVELAAAAVCAFIVGGIGWRLWMRSSGRYVAYYRDHQWR